jgi:hypothetical protein
MILSSLTGLQRSLREGPGLIAGLVEDTQPLAARFTRRGFLDL